MGGNLLVRIIRLSITPSAKRNSYRVAKGKPHPNLPQGEGVPPKAHPNHYKPHPSLPQGEGVPPQAHPKHYCPIPTTTRPIPAFPKRKENHQTASNTAGRNSRPLGRAGEGPQEAWWGCVDRIVILPFFATKSTKNIVFVSAFIIFFIILRSEREIRLRPVVISPGSGRSFIHTGAI